jgi:hypothetical protein
MDSEHRSAAPPWGAGVNFRPHPWAKNRPAPGFSDHEERQGLYIWEGKERRVSLSATQAIALLDCLRADDSRQRDGIVKKSPALLSQRKNEGRDLVGTQGPSSFWFSWTSCTPRALCCTI